MNHCRILMDSKLFKKRLAWIENFKIVELCDQEKAESEWIKMIKKYTWF